VAWDYYAAPSLAFTGGAHRQGDNVVKVGSVKVVKVVE